MYISLSTQSGNFWIHPCMLACSEDDAASEDGTGKVVPVLN